MEGPVVMDVKDLPMEFDVLLTDLNSADLHTKVGDLFGVRYLSEVEPKLKEYVFVGRLWGSYDRPLLALDVRRRATEKPRIVVFLVDTGSPFSYLSEECLRKFGIELTDPTSPVSMMLNDRHHKVYMSL